MHSSRRARNQRIIKDRLPHLFIQTGPCRVRRPPPLLPSCAPRQYLGRAPSWWSPAPSSGGGGDEEMREDARLTVSHPISSSRCSWSSRGRPELTEDVTAGRCVLSGVGGAAGPGAQPWQVATTRPPTNGGAGPFTASTRWTTRGRRHWGNGGSGLSIDPSPGAIAPAVPRYCGTTRPAQIYRKTATIMLHDNRI